MRGITSPTRCLSVLTAHFNMCIPVVVHVLLGPDCGTVLKRCAKAANVFDARLRKMSRNWTTEWPLRPLFGHSLSGRELTITESYTPCKFAVEGGTLAQSV